MTDGIKNLALRKSNMTKFVNMFTNECKSALWVIENVIR